MKNYIRRVVFVKRCGMSIATCVIIGVILGTAVSVAMKCMKKPRNKFKRTAGIMLEAIGEAMEDFADNMR